MRPGQQPQPEILGDVGVLIFIDKDVPEPTLVLFQHIRMGLEDRDHVQQQVAEIDGVQLLQTSLVLIVQFGPAVIIGPGLGRGDFLRCPGAVLPAIDDRGKLARRPAFVVDIGRSDQLLQQAQLVVGVENGEVGFQTDQFRVAAQQLDADRVKGTEPRHPLDVMAQHPGNTLFHLARRLVGEGNGEDLVWSGRSGRQQVHDARSQRAGLARARPCQHQHRAFQPLDSFALRLVQPVQIGRRSRGHGAGRQGGPFERLHLIETAHDQNLARIGTLLKSCSHFVPSFPGKLPASVLYGQSGRPRG